MRRVEVLREFDLKGHRLPILGVSDKEVNTRVLGRKPDVPARKRSLDMLPDKVLTHMDCEHRLQVPLIHHAGAARNDQ